MRPDGASEITSVDELARRFLNEWRRAEGIRSSEDKKWEDCSEKSTVQKSASFKL